MRFVHPSWNAVQKKLRQQQLNVSLFTFARSFRRSTDTRGFGLAAGNAGWCDWGALQKGGSECSSRESRPVCAWEGDANTIKPQELPLSQADMRLAK